MADYDRKLHAALTEIVQRLFLLEREVSPALISRARPELPVQLPSLPSDSGPSSVDAAGGDGPLPPSAPVSPAGADLIQRLELVERYIGPSALAWARCQRWHCPTDCECRAVPVSGPPGAAAAKESSDTTAAAPARAALHDAEPLRDPDCNCEQSLELQQKLTEIAAERSLCLDGFKSSPAALDAIGLILRGG